MFLIVFLGCVQWAGCADPFLFTGLANITFDKMEQRINCELAARRLARNEPLAARRLARDEPLAAAAPWPARPSAPHPPMQRNGSTHLRYETVHLPWVYYDPNYDQMLGKMKGIMQQNIYAARERMQAVSDVLDRNKESMRFRMGFVFRKLEDLLAGLRVMWMRVMRAPDDNYFAVLKTFVYYQYAQRKYVDFVYIYERVINVYEKYMELKKMVFKDQIEKKFTNPP